MPNDFIWTYLDRANFCLQKYSNSFVTNPRSCWLITRPSLVLVVLLQSAAKLYITLCKGSCIPMLYSHCTLSTCNAASGNRTKAELSPGRLFATAGMSSPLGRSMVYWGSTPLSYTSAIRIFPCRSIGTAQDSTICSTATSETRTASSTWHVAFSSEEH